MIREILVVLLRDICADTARTLRRLSRYPRYVFGAGARAGTGGQSVVRIM
jgi:hypothetical protein